MVVDGGDGGDQIGLAVRVEIGRGDPVRDVPDLKSRVAESPIAATQVDGVVVAGQHDVLPAVPVEIAHGVEIRAARLIRQRRERTCAGMQEGVQKPEAVGDEVSEPVPVEIGDGHPSAGLRQTGTPGKAPVAATEKQVDSEPGWRKVGDRDVIEAIAVEIASGKRRRLAGGAKARCEPERSVSVPQEHQGEAGRDIAADVSRQRQVELAIVVEVSQGDMLVSLT